MGQIDYREDLVFYLLREHINIDKIDDIIMSFNEKDWDEIAVFLQEQSLFPIFYDRLIGLNLKNIPSEFLLKLKRMYLINLQRNALLERELFKLNGYFEESNIPLIPLKGIILCRLLYNDIALRGTSSDLDLLIPYEKLKDAENKLQESGYSFLNNEELVDIQHKVNKEIVFRKKIGNSEILLDLHWYIADERLNDSYIRDFWKNTRKINLDGNQILIPSIDDLIFYLSLHAVNYGHFVAIKYIYDMHRTILVYSKEIDWQKVMRKAKENNLENSLFYSLSFCRDLFQTPVPEEVINSLRPHHIKEVVLRQWINKFNATKRWKVIISSWMWYFFVSPLLYTSNFFNYLELVINRRFLPMEYYVEFYTSKEAKLSFTNSIRKLILKILKCFFKISHSERKIPLSFMPHITEKSLDRNLYVKSGE